MSLKNLLSFGSSSVNFSNVFAEPQLSENLPRLAVTEEGLLTYASPAFCDLAGQTLGTLKNLMFFDIATFSNFEIKRLSDIKTGTHILTLKGQREHLPFHFDWLETPGGKRYLIGSHEPESDDSNEETPESFPATDIQKLFDLSHQLFVVADLQGHILQTNTAFERLFSAKSFFDLCDCACQITSNNVITLTSQNISSSGEACEIAWRVARDGDRLYCAGQDVTAIKNQEKALQNREKQLGEAESLGRMGHWIWPLGQERMEWSAEILKIFGVQEADFEPSLKSMNAMIHRQDIARVNQAFQRALIEENDYDMEFRLTRPDGEVRYIRCEGRCARDDAGEVYALYGIMQDMTERYLYEEQLRAAKESAERAYAAKTQFLANMSHELRTPLNAIIGFSELMERQLLGPVGTPKYLEYVGGIRESGEHLLDLINDILDMSKIEAGKYELDIEPLSVAKTIKLAVHMMEGRAHECRIRLAVDPAVDETLKITADRRAIMQILLNLLSNAVKFSHEGGTVQVQCLARDNGVMIKVIDQGIGIPAGKLNSITKPFEQVSPSHVRNHEGSGLGLAITKELVEMHGGALSIESMLGTGTTVTVRLPYTSKV